MYDATNSILSGRVLLQLTMLFCLLWFYCPALTDPNHRSQDQLMLIVTLGSQSIRRLCASALPLRKVSNWLADVVKQVSLQCDVV